MHRADWCPSGCSRLACLSLAILCASCTTPGTWSFPITTPYWCADPGERIGAGALLGPLALVGTAVDFTLLPVTATRDLLFHEPVTDAAAPTVPAEPVTAARPAASGPPRIAATPAPAQAPAPQETGTPTDLDGWHGEFRGLLGARMLSDDFFAPVREQFVLGIEATARPGDSGFALEAGLTAGIGLGDWFTEEVEESHVFDFTAGARYTLFHEDRIRPYIGAGVGVMFINARLDNDDVSGSDHDVALIGYLRSGVDFGISQTLVLGIDVRAAVGPDVDLLGTSVEPDYVMIGLTFGAPW
jgi:hypothetical protein